MKEDLKKYCKSRNLNFIEFSEEEIKNMEMVLFSWSTLSDMSSLNLSEKVINNLIEMFYTELDKEFKFCLKKLNLKKISKITISDENAMFVS